MKLLGLLIQNKKGQPLLISTSACLSTHNTILYSHTIYQHILENYRSRNKIQRTLLIDNNLLCVCNISKEYICYVFVRKDDLSLAFDAIRKITEYFSSANKANTPNRLENLTKKAVEYMSIMEQFLYTRQIFLLRDQYLPFTAPATSRKKGVDFQIFNKFAHITNDSDRRWMLEGQMISSRVEVKEFTKKAKTHQMCQKFSKKCQQDMLEDLLDIDPQKEKFIQIYKKAIVRMGVAVGGRKSINSFHSALIASQSSIIQSNSIPQTQSTLNKQQSYDYSLISEGYESLIFQKEEKIPINKQWQDDKQKAKAIKIKFIEKLQLHMHNTKVKQVIQIGQLMVQSTSMLSGNFDCLVKLLSPQWLNNKIMNKRVSPNSIPIQQIDEQTVKFKFASLSQKAKPVLDYVIRKQTFTSQKIPLLFMYNMEVSSNNIEFTFKYKLNEKYTKKLLDVQIIVYLNSQFIPVDCKTVPAAHSLKNHKVTWKTKEISSQSSSNSQNKAKGKILLAFGSTNIPPNNIIKQIRLTMKSYSSIIQGLQVGIQISKNKQMMDLIIPKQIQKMMIVEYKVLPNDSTNNH